MSKKDDQYLNFHYGRERYFTPEEQRRLDYLGMKAVIETAREDGREIRYVLSTFENGIPIPIIAKSLKISEEKVQNILDNERYRQKMATESKEKNNQETE